jgi:uncharacterized membrane protein YidH (DUF202 family)
MKGAIYILLSLALAAVGIWQMVAFLPTVDKRPYGAYGNTTALIISVVCILAAVAFAGLYFAGRVNKEEELHITK